MGDLLRRVRTLGREPTAEERLADLLELHEARPGITEATLGACTTLDGRTGYALLAAEVPERARAVLDLGCGNGPLLEAVHRARPSVERLVGVDACASDLALARARLPAPLADLRCERADRLSLPDASVDAVLSHHAFYLFHPIEQALAEARRVLRSGGLFACVTWTFGSGGGEPFAAMMDALGALTAGDVPAFSGWADRRNFDRRALESLLVSAGFEPPLEIEEHALVLDEPAEAIVARLMRFFYSVDLQRPETREHLRRAWLACLAPATGADGRAVMRFPFALTRIRKPGAS